jgi:predicted dehydrogenase
MLQGAFIGFGNVAAHGHVPGWQARDDATIVAACDATGSRRQVFLTAYPQGHWYDTIDDLLANETLDFVDICTPPGSHASLILRALGAGLDVLCEKPLVTRFEDAISVAAARAGRVVHCVHNWLEAPICRSITALIAEGAIGTVRSVRWQTLRTQPAVVVATGGAGNWRVNPATAGGGILFDHGWHALYCVNRWIGGTPRSVSASLQTRRFHEWPLEDTATLKLKFDTASGHIFLTWAADERANHIEVEGELGRIHIDGSNIMVEGPSGARSLPCAQSLSEGSHHPDWFAGVAKDFCAAVTSRAAGNLDDAILCARLLDLAQKSSNLGGARLALGN